MLSHPDYRWIDCPEGSYLQFRYSCVALVVRRERGCSVEVRAKRDLHARAPGLEQGKRYVERWIEKQPGFYFGRVRRRDWSL